MCLDNVGILVYADQRISTSVRYPRKNENMSFGRLIADTRKQANMSQRELAAQIRKEDDEPISAQYLNDLERGRRNPPPDYLLRQFAAVLSIPLDVLYYYVGEIPEDLRDIQVDQDTIEKAYAVFRKAIKPE